MWSSTGPTNHGKSTGCIPKGCPTTWVYRWVYPQSLAVWHSWWKNEDEPPFSSWQNDWKHHWIWGYHSFRSGYGSIPINTIFRGMNIHLSQLFWCSPGVQGFLTHPHLTFFLKTKLCRLVIASFYETLPCNLTIKKPDTIRGSVVALEKMTGRIWWEQPWLPDVAQIKWCTHHQWCVFHIYAIHIYICICIIYKTTLYIHTCIIHMYIYIYNIYIYTYVYTYIYIYTRGFLEGTGIYPDNGQNPFGIFWGSSYVLFDLQYPKGNSFGTSQV